MSEENMTNGIVRSTVEDIHTPAPESELEYTTTDLLSGKCSTGGPNSNSRLDGTFGDLECHGFTNVPITAELKIKTLQLGGSEIKREKNVNFLSNQSSHIRRAKVVSEEKNVKMRNNVTSATDEIFYQSTLYKMKPRCLNGSETLDTNLRSNTDASVEASMDTTVNRSATYKMADDLQSLYKSNDSRSYTMASDISFFNIENSSIADDKAAGALPVITLNSSNTALMASKFLTMIKSNRSSSVTTDANSLPMMKSNNSVRPIHTLVAQSQSMAPPHRSFEHGDVKEGNSHSMRLSSRNNTMGAPLSMTTVNSFKRISEKIDSNFLPVVTSTSSIAQTITKGPSFAQASGISNAGTVTSVLFPLVPPISPAYERADGSLQSMNTRNNNRIVTSAEGSLSLNTSWFSYVYLKSTQSMHYSKRALSCRHRCGQEYSFPCSCEEKCVVHKTCCEDLAEACPELYSQALTKFRHLLFESVRCDSMSAVFMVESCPLGLHTEGDDLSQNPVYVASDENPDDMEKGKAFSLSEILLNAPVTDFETGIIYANASIYDCNKQNKSSSFSETSSGIVQVWSTQIGTLDQSYPEKIEDLNTQLDLSTYSYIPPQWPNSISSSLCFSEEIISCISMLIIEYDIQDLTCNRTVKFYYSSREHSLRFLFHEYVSIIDKVCVLCLSEYQKAEEHGNRYFLTGFKVLMALSETPGHVKYDLPFELQINTIGTPWWSGICSTADQTNVSCRVLACSPRFLLVGSNLCLRQVEAELSIQSEILIKGKTCRIDHEAFAEAITCCLQSLYKLKPSNQYLRFYQIYSVPENINLTVVRMKLYFDDSSFNNHLKKLKEGYVPLYSAMLVFAQQHCLLNGERIEWRNFTKEKLLKTLSQQTSTGRHTRIAERVHSLTIEDIRTIETLLNHFVFSMCVQLAPVDTSLDDDIKCDYQFDKKIGMAIKKLDDVVSQLRNLKCFTGSDVTHKSSISKMRGSVLFLCFSIFVNLLTK